MYNWAVFDPPPDRSPPGIIHANAGVDTPMLRNPKVNIAGPRGPVGPVLPVEPVEPVAPVGPVEPVAPVSPRPVGPVEPVAPVPLADPGIPC